MADFSLDPRLMADTHRLGKLAACHVLLHRQAAVPWFILVPETEATELFDLPESERAACMAETFALADWLRRRYQPEKVNIAAIGNIVRQLHIHVIGRWTDDPCWPGVVWGRLNDPRRYSPEDVDQIAENLAQMLGLHRISESQGGRPPF
jgi:diadenosine tetraphosphate (Ap4A) HIT family hydrolase